MAKGRGKYKKRDDTARIVAQIHGVSQSYVEKVRRGERENEEVLATLIDYQVGKNALIKHLESLIQVSPKTKKYAR